MSGHSHWASIKHKKGAEDAKRSKVFSKVSKLISVAVREKGADPATNPSLRTAIEQAKQVNMPKENIERSIKKGTGELAGESLDSFIFEAFGPDNVALIIEGITDNKNRTLGDIKQILSQHNGKLAGEGSIKWMFERKGVISIAEKRTEELELKIIESGAEDIKWQDDMADVITKPEELEQVKSILEKEGLKIENSSLGWIPKEEVDANKEKLEKLFESLDDNDSVQNIYSNAKW
ncbi:MAG: transcriptional regulator [Candidatus Nealsonbacteria bacterium RIFOXYB1_FULL_40_15]|uniref:Probable transcriptional regulatory protein A2427_03560 n=2 Tax=Candidatus Nealsoniibacteriota TaxID=1817911 RepID=A0A1G2ESD8_9BACT|nr:MAG: transcriptional regulator [Candidatus Nealsonbacteria bacterium RIFOXYB1_FULL_40_15]OGZ28725.1 MAG: transcriptional regulator [Candidatus Nealsonbacteria bacterium RIFOXYC1_FULL_40_7]OGZ29721.1 MAG: transcriptional regulator [Candidatus Nealsonbacteria bacterium RIFOXYD1_FULL_39_11]